MLYELHFVGGPDDGQMTFAFHPYYKLLNQSTRTVYRARMEANQPIMEWVDDDTRAITMYFQGYESKRRRSRQRKRG